MKNFILLTTLLLLTTALAFSYPKEVDDLNIIICSTPQGSNGGINSAIAKLERLDGTDIQKQTYKNIAATTRTQLDKEPKKNKSSKFKNLQTIIDGQKDYFSSNDADYLTSIADLIMAAIKYASLGNVVEYSKQATNLYEEALKVNPKHFNALLSYGILKGYMPSAFGGGINKCLPLFERALSSASSTVEKYQIYLWISQAYFEKKDYDNYNKYFALAEAIYPNGAFTTAVKESNANKKSIFKEPVVQE